MIKTNKPTPKEPPQQTTPEATIVDGIAIDRNKPKGFKKFIGFFKRITKKQWIIFAVAILFTSAWGLVGWKLLHKKSVPPPVVTKTIPKPIEPPKPTTEPSRLTGVEIAIETNKRPVTGIMIENSPDARPQSGLKDAGIIFEAQAEGGITRFLTLFLEAQPDYIGPVRSIRPYYLDFLAPFDASIAHAGGSAEALEQVRSGAFKDMDQFFNPDAYQRVNTRYAPHNLYTSMAQMDALNLAKGFTSSTFTSLPRKKETPIAVPTAAKIDLAVSSFLYNPHYDYDAGTNSYKRSEGGAPHMDEKSNTQLQPKVVVALVMPRSQNSIYSVYQTTGSAPMYVFQDGVFTIGTWSKASRKEQFVFKDAAGQPLALNPGQTWISIVPTAGAVTYSP